MRQVYLAGFLLSAILVVSCSTPEPGREAAQTEAAAQPPGPHPGEGVYLANCASCHDNSELTKSPSKETLTRMSPGMIAYAMVSGKMSQQAAHLTSGQISEVASYLSRSAGSSDAWIDAMMCPADRRVPSLAAEPTVAGFGFDRENTRTLSYSDAGLTADDLKDMKVAWVIAWPEMVTMRSQPAVVGSTLFTPVGESKNRMFALDVSAEQPCIQWTYQANRVLRSSAGYGVREDGRKIVLVADYGGFVHMVDALTGKLIWETHIGLSASSIGSSTPVLVGDKVYAASSQYELTMAQSERYVCCKSQGGVVALDARTGAKAWVARTMEPAKPVRDRGDGQMLWGPSGAPIWNSPSIDVKRNRLYVGTGEATSPPAHRNTNAIMAFDLTDGSVKWSHQATPNDIYVGGCSPNGKKHLNCVANEETVFRDVDFGASTIIARSPDGKDLVLAGQKSGAVWAMNPDTGAVVWRTDLGHGGPMGGIHWGIAADDTHVYAPISNVGRQVPGEPAFDPEAIKVGIYAVNLNDGKIDWSFHTTPDCSGDRKTMMPRCATMYGMSGAPTVIGEYVITGGLDGWLYVLEKASGKLVWKYDTARSFETINGVAGNGGTIDNASIIGVDGLLIVNSGYGLFGQAAGNVMIAFKPRGS
jgi:polyvinyl alcohol dehydrogenase (cytochrome)